MTAFPSPANHGRWWVTTWAGWNRLHAIPRDAVDPDDEDALEEFSSEGVTATAACGVSTRWAWPGVSSRLGRPRCKHCCRALGIAAGNGTPANEEARKQRMEEPA